MDDFKMTENFGYFEMTKTSNAALQDFNRAAAKNHLGQLQCLAEMLERVRAYLGAPLLIHSGYRCPELNGATPGSSNKSQHMRGEAADLSCPSKFQANDDGNSDLFKAIKNFMSSRSLRFGQLIDEGCDRPYGHVVWIHLSLGAPWRESARCGQTLRMRNGVFEDMGVVPQP